jgi:hypothetical protein
VTRRLANIPWYWSATATIALAAILAIGTNVLIGPYFERSFLNEADPLASAGAPPPEDTTPDAAGAIESPAAATASPADAAGVLLHGEWRDGEPGHNGEGRVRIGRDAGGKLVLRVEEFSVTNGPDLFVVLSPDPDGYADGSLNLGELKATDGNFNYEIPEGADLSLYESVVVWCRSFDVTFAYATLEEV